MHEQEQNNAQHTHNETRPLESQYHEGEHVDAGAPKEKQSGPVGPVIGIIIIIALLIFGGLYFWGSQLNNQDEQQDEVPLILGNDDPNTSAESAGTEAESTEPGAIEEDFETTDLNALESELDADLKALENEL